MVDLLSIRHVLILIFLSSLLINVCWSDESKSLPNESSLFDLNLVELLKVRVQVASKRSESINEAPGSITLISREQIENMNARTLRDVLNIYVPGMDVVPTYFRYGDRVNEGIYSRGLLSDFSQQVLILFNGKTKFNETTFGSAFPAVEFTLDNIERIEISRSPVPLYGSSAITIINLITREQTFLGFEYRAESTLSQRQTSQNLMQAYKFTTLFGKNLDQWHIGGSVQYYQDDGQAHGQPKGQGSYGFDRETLRDGTKGAGNFTFSLRSLDNAFVFQTWYKFNVQDAFLSGQVPSQSLDLYSYEGSQWHGNLKYTLSEQWNITFGTMTSEFVNFIDLAGEPYGGSVANYDIFIESLYEKEVDEHSLLLGFKVEREGQYDAKVYLWNGSGFDISEDESQIFAPNKSRNVFAFFVEDNWQISDTLSVVLGGRIDAFEGFSKTSERVFNPRVAFTWRNNQSIFKGLYASAVRPPSIYETLGTALFPLQGSRDVKPEKIETFELSWIYQGNDYRAQLTPFYLIFNDKIEYLPENNSFIARNNGKTTVAGIDTEFNYYFSKKNYLFIKHSKFKSRDEASDRDTYFLPNEYLSFGANYRIFNFNVNLSSYYRSKRTLPEELASNIRYSSGAHKKTDLNIAYYFQGESKVYLNLSNLFDEKNNVPLSVDELFVPLRGFTVHLGYTFEI
ncbi:TonB-dependent receptor plug domain-containing protein [Pleionea sediminis]|uniref:TonB-dependent receptor plug domain-containing protein n=1 Tax=Pleionea sediminis TaxID=2569479 RepID=UPI0011869888|nr:TonB-dependent receptor [Pleionea sediminis]